MLRNQGPRGGPQKPARPAQPGPRQPGQGPPKLLFPPIYRSGIRDRRRPPQVTAGIAGGILRRPGDRRAGPTKRVHFADDLPTLRFGVPEREQHAGPGRRRPARRRRLHGVSQPLPGQMLAPPHGAMSERPARPPSPPGQETPAVRRKFLHGPSEGIGGQGWEVTKF
ncbi:hypothetical protein MTO96_006366 [Rhipicephalus appendiculatus]